MRPGQPKRKSGLKRTELKRVRKERRHRRVTVKIEAAVRWHRGIEGLPCARCDKAATQAHHIIRRQVIVREAVARGYDRELMEWHVDNRLPLCWQCHTDHHHGKPLTVTLLWRKAPRVFAFAERIGLAHWIEREYAA